MDFVDRISGRALDFSGVLKFSHLDVRVQDHLKKVYATLACALVVCALGVTCNNLLGIGGTMSFLGCVGSCFWLMSTPNHPSTLYKRYSLLAATAFLKGCSIGPLMNTALIVAPAALMTAVLATAGVFMCFSFAALLSPRRSYIFMGGTLSSAVVVLFVARIFNLRSFHLEIYGGLAVFLLYIIYDTQMIIEKASAGHDDHVKAALDLFVDFVAVLVRLTLILTKKSEEKKKSNRRD